MSERDKILEKVGKLLTKARNHATTAEESLSYHAKARALMVEWEIADGEVGMERKTEYMLKRFTWGKEGFVSWRATLMQAAAKMYFAQFSISAYENGDTSDQFMLYGREHNITMATNFGGYLIAAVRHRLAAQGKNALLHPRYAEGFCTKAAVVLADRIEKAMAAPVEASNVPALITTAVLEAFNKHLEGLGAGRVQDIEVESVIPAGAGKAGGKAGEEISLDRQIGADIAEALLQHGD